MQLKEIGAFNYYWCSKSDLLTLKVRAMSGCQNEAVTDDHIGAYKSIEFRRIAKCPANGSQIIGVMKWNEDRGTIEIRFSTDVILIPEVSLPAWRFLSVLSKVDVVVKLFKSSVLMPSPHSKRKSNGCKVKFFSSDKKKLEALWTYWSLGCLCQKSCYPHFLDHGCSELEIDSKIRMEKDFNFWLEAFCLTW